MKTPSRLCFLRPVGTIASEAATSSSSRVFSCRHFLGDYDEYSELNGYSEWLIEQAKLRFDSVGSFRLRGRMAGAHPVAWLAEQPIGIWGNWSQRQDENLGLLDLIHSTAGQPDFDIDGDGLECLFDLDGDRELDMCCDGNGAAACSFAGCKELPQVDQTSFVPCAGAAGFADGYSVSYQLEAVPATIVGVAR